MHTWDDAVRYWRAEKQFRTEQWKKDEAAHLRRLAPHLSGKPLDAIDAEALHGITLAILQTGVGPYTVNAHLAVVRAILRAAVAWGWLGAVPRFRMMKRPPAAVRHITPDQARRFLEHLPAHTRDVAAFSLETGLRKRNVLGLLWEWVDLHDRMIYIPAQSAKGRRPISIPISDVAAAILERWSGQHISHVFHYRGRAIRESNTRAYRLARERAGLGRFRWHDLRHTWASWHAMSGTPLLVLQQLGGWNTVAMVNHYAHLQTDGLRPWVDQVGRWRERRSVRPSTGLRLAA